MENSRTIGKLETPRVEDTMEEIANKLSGSPGDIVVVSGHRVGDHERLGEILEVLGEGDHAHYRVRWDDGAESIFYPGSDATIRPSRKTQAGRSSR